MGNVTESCNIDKKMLIRRDYMEKNAYIIVPNKLIYDKNSENNILVYIGISKRRMLLDKTVAITSIVDLCETSNYSIDDRRRKSFYSLIKPALNSFIEMGLIKIDNFDDVKPQTLIKIRLTDGFEPKEKYTPITMQELKTILNCKSYKSLSALVRVYLYVKSLMYMDYRHTNAVISAYYVAREVAARALKISIAKYDRCINTLCDLGLLVCHQTGSYYDYNGIKNAPNIFVLNDEQAESNINGAINRLKYSLLNSEYGNSDEFMPIVYTGKKFKESIEESEEDDEEEYEEDDEFDEDYGDEWGESNPMYKR